MDRHRDLDFGDLGPEFVTWVPRARPELHFYPDLEQQLALLVGTPGQQLQSMPASDWATTGIQKLIRKAGWEPRELQVATLASRSLDAMLIRSSDQLESLASAFRMPGLIGPGVAFVSSPVVAGAWYAIRDGWIEYVGANDCVLMWVTAFTSDVQEAAEAALSRFLR